MIVEKIIKLTLKFCCRKKGAKSRSIFEGLKSFLKKTTVFGHTESDKPKNKKPKNKIYPVDWTGRSDNGNVDSYSLRHIGIDKKVGMKPITDFQMAMLNIHDISKYNDVGDLKDQIATLRKKSQATNASPAQAMTFKNYPAPNSLGVNFSPIKIQSSHKKVPILFPRSYKVKKTEVIHPLEILKKKDQMKILEKKDRKV